MLIGIFWGAIALCAYTYGGYLLTLVIIDALRTLRANERYLSGHGERRTDRRTPDLVLPSVSVLIAAHNEAACLREKIANTMAFDYPREKLEILIGSDGSTDETESIARESGDPRVKLLAAPRQGKAMTLNRLAQVADGSLWLFTDANTDVEPSALRALVARMREADVGAVCGRLRLMAPKKLPQEGLYWRFENLLKFYESRLGAVMGANGGLYLLRREEWRPLPLDTVVDDFLVTMRVVSRGKRVVYAPEALATEETSSDHRGEFRRRVRIAAGNFQSLRELWPMLVRPGFPGFAFWAHKVIRWCVPFCLIALLLASALLSARPVYLLAFVVQLTVYGLAFGSRGGLGRNSRAVDTLRYFVEMNVALALGFGRWIRGTQPATWQRTARSLTTRSPS